MLEKIREIICDQLNVDASEVTPDASFKDDLGADSLDLFELVMTLEDEYDLEIPTDDLMKIVTIGDVIEYMKIITRKQEFFLGKIPAFVMSAYLYVEVIKN